MDIYSSVQMCFHYNSNIRIDFSDFCYNVLFLLFIFFLIMKKIFCVNYLFQRDSCHLLIYFCTVLRKE